MRWVDCKQRTWRRTSLSNSSIGQSATRSVVFIMMRIAVGKGCREVIGRHVGKGRGYARVIQEVVEARPSLIIVATGHADMSSK
jgi:hypothetical protein